ncbi:hypothetical protein FM106_28510 [Brachybacterium faecium]|nr:hypothetical protein FM106_28510 [Brachybacterium faecium]
MHDDCAHEDAPSIGAPGTGPCGDPSRGPRRAAAEKSLRRGVLTGTLWARSAGTGQA